MDELLEILHELHPDIDFETYEGLVDDKVIDSYDIITIISEVHDKFDIMIDANSIIPENFNSAKALYRLIQEKMDEED